MTRSMRFVNSPHPTWTEKKAWVEVQILDQAEKPVANQWVIITLADDKTIREKTDAQGMITLQNIATGECSIEMENLDKSAFE